MLRVTKEIFLHGTMRADNRKQRTENVPGLEGQKQSPQTTGRNGTGGTPYYAYF